MMRYLLLTLVPVMFFSGCANQHHLGTHVAQVRQEQVYNPNASIENLGVIPTGTGEKMEGVYGTYSGKKGESINSANSQILNGFSN